MGRRGGTRTPLARQFLVWQLVVVLVLLGAVAALAAVQSAESFRETHGRRMLSVAEDVASVPTVREALQRRQYDLLPSFARSAENLSGADEIEIVDAGLVVRTSPDPSRVRERFDPGASTAPAGRAWVGAPAGRTVVAQVPVIDDRGAVAGLVSAGIRAPSLWESLAGARTETVALLGLALGVGVAGSLLLARRVRRQTLGLEPGEIVELVQRREAMLLGIKEGVVGLDTADRITLLNPVARELLELPGARPGDPVADLGLDDRLREVLTGAAAGEDQLVLRDTRALVLNRMPVRLDGREVGAVVTLRDRTELTTLQHRLDASHTVTDTLRAQAHEFSNRLHTIAGLTELGEHEEVRRFVAGIVAASEGWRREVSSRVGDAATAALLVAKNSRAAERGVELTFDPDSRLEPTDPERDPDLSADLVTVLGNLIDNAVDATAGRSGERRVQIGLSGGGDDGGGEVWIEVRDSGPGVASELAEEVFRAGFSTKAAEIGGRGLGLALARQACLRRGGMIAVQDAAEGTGAVFVAVLPVAGEPATTGEEVQR
ncbi:Signal transduction histidine kinase CitA regulating citrate metabolism [Pseudonocardia sp. Ae168_Ps1]|uniref:sensor histidine kinase n=1 Tax=unclassified Pseudonocardia TaxID=2619320 RepID=UPI00094B5001|nr:MULTISPECIES: sensor histidine kinase [unclassified Pseudonocardia]OLL76200.1 Signal transduction histidine kinase CitA regulating citrate metabolism [Pseudonocardia sp. Ae150A_Ps1]OLL82200.1 Signal transduction histidine kinase CitA regulating citrate metabolism [Pseudonocardia sp. Ae168_Ps1]OLL83685.1 Signal transduction histidine kinase CitA regulating citrate metabolism [Pseudonocardia sp. Ae263_Ps1]OLL90274.1 Signal transduction histidine kinase CitA regulating citrate metabolism [Pseud